MKVFDMNFFEFLLSFFASSLVTAWFTGILGRLLYALGLKKVGHWLACSSLAPNFVTDSWIIKHCPHECKKCERCKMWTCSRKYVQNDE